MKEQLHHSTHRIRGTRFPAPVRRIVVLRALHLGDLLCATPALRELQRRFPQAKITLIGLPWARDFTERLAYIDRLLPFPGYPGILETDYVACARAAVRSRDPDARRRLGQQRLRRRARRARDPRLPS